MAYGACYLKGTRFFDRGGMIAGPSPRSARWPIGIAAFGLCLPFFSRPGKALATKEGVHVAAASAPFLVNGAAGSASTKKERIHLR